RPGRLVQRRPRLEDHLDAAVALVAKHRIGLRRLLQRQAMGDDDTGVYLALLDALQQRTQIAVDVGLPRLQRQPLVHQGTQGNLVRHTGVDPGHGHGATLAAGHDGLAQGHRPLRLQPRRLLEPVVPALEPDAMGFHADRVDAGVRTAPSGQLAQRLRDFQRVADFARPQRLHARLVHGHLQPLADVVDGDDALRPLPRRLLEPVVPALEPDAMGFHADRVDAGVRTAPSGQLAQRLRDFQRVADFARPQRLHARLVHGHLQPLADVVDGDDALRP